MKKKIEDSTALKMIVFSGINLLKNTEAAINESLKSFKKGGKVLFCVNGGSHTTTQLLSAGLKVWYYDDRTPLNTVILQDYFSFLTSNVKDYLHIKVYVRLKKTVPYSEDVLIELSTSSNSINVVNEYGGALKMGFLTEGFAGKGADFLEKCTNILNEVPSINTKKFNSFS